MRDRGMGRVFLGCVLALGAAPCVAQVFMRLVHEPVGARCTEAGYVELFRECGAGTALCFSAGVATEDGLSEVAAVNRWLFLQREAAPACLVRVDREVGRVELRRHGHVVFSREGLCGASELVPDVKHLSVSANRDGVCEEGARVAQRARLRHLPRTEAHWQRLRALR